MSGGAGVMHFFMAPPTFAKMYEISGEVKYLDYAIEHWLITTDYLWDKKKFNIS